MKNIIFKTVVDD